MHDAESPHISPLLIDEATRTVEQLIEELEPALDHNQCRTLHRLRLACESLGMLRATSKALTVSAGLHGAWEARR